MATVTRHHSPRRWVVVCALLFAGALSLRLIGLDWGLPYTDHPDEPSATNRVLGMLRRDDWNPHFFGKPGLYYYLLREVVALHVKRGIANGTYHSLDDLPETTDRYLTAPGIFVWERALTALLGALTVPLTFLVGRRWWGMSVGILAALVVAVVPLHVRHSQYVTLDVPTTLFTLLALAASLRLLTRAQWCDYALAGALVGLATATKYNGALTAVALLTAHVLHWRSAAVRQLWRPVLAGVCSLAVFAITNPYLILDADAFLNGVIKQYNDYSPQTQGDLRRTWPIASYLSFFFWDLVTFIPAIAALVGIARTLQQRAAPGLVLLAYALAYPLAFLPQSTHYFRNMMPLVPVAAIFAGIGAAWLWEWLRRGMPRWQWPALAVVAVALCAYPFQSAYGLVRFEAQPHSKVRAATYIREQLPHGLPIAVTLNPVQWANQPFITPVDSITAHNAAWYRQAGYRYLVAESEQADRTAYANLRAESVLLAHMAGDDEGMPGPGIDILDLGTTTADIAFTPVVAQFGDQLLLRGFEDGAGALRAAYSPLAQQPGDAQAPLQLNLYFEVRQSLDPDTTLFVHVLDQNGQRVAQRDTPLRQDTTAAKWRPGELIAEIADVPLPANLPHNVYHIVIGLYSTETGQRLSVPGQPDNTVELMAFNR